MIREYLLARGISPFGKGRLEGILEIERQYNYEVVNPRNVVGHISHKIHRETPDT